MLYFDPPQIEPRTLQKAGLSHAKLIPIRPYANSSPQNCLNNVTNYIKEHGGQLQLGWIFSIMGNIALKLTAHAVLRNAKNELICITPNPYRKNKLRFAPDDSVELLIVNNCLPLKLLPLINNPVLDEYLALEKEMDNLRLNNAGLVANSDLQRITLLSQCLYPQILKLAKVNTHMKDYCFCGSNKLRLKCCR